MELNQELRNEYLYLWQTCQINPAYASNLDGCINSIKNGRSRYEHVASETGVPWYVIAVIHGMESSYNFNCHLHNGDPLTARTIEGPAGRPPQGSPPFTWEESAIDALNYDGAAGIQSWDLPTIFWFLEKFNGWGYRVGRGRDTTPPCRSAYIFSGTNHYEKGKYVGNGDFDRNAVSAQVSCMAQLKELESMGLIDIDPSVNPYDPDVVGSVADWQHVLNGCGYSPVLVTNGSMDQRTVAMTKDFQKDLGLTQTGAVDLPTWRAGLNHKKLRGWVPVTPIVVPGRVNDLCNVSKIRRLYNFWSQDANDRLVYRTVMQTYGTTSNACAAFVSTALRLSGCESDLPLILWTANLSKALEQRGWNRSEDASQLQPGDIVFSDDTGYNDGIPNHVYLFAGWKNQQTQIANVIDNQGFIHGRNIRKGSGRSDDYNFSPFWYFVRA